MFNIRETCASPFVLSFDEENFFQKKHFPNSGTFPPKRTTYERTFKIGFEFCFDSSCLQDEMPRGSSSHK